jgi:hypothetical protein
MKSKRQIKTQVRKTAGDDPPPLAKPVPPGTVRKSPLSEEVEMQAQKLIHEAGSPNAAKSAVDVAAEREHEPDFQEDHFALRWGFASRAEMRAASKPLTAGDGTPWWATALPSGRWVVWNKEHLAAAETFASLDVARRSLEGASAKE